MTFHFMNSTATPPIEKSQRQTIICCAYVEVRPEDIDLPLRQLSLSQAIDNASHRLLVSSATSIRSRALALSSSLPHAGDWLNVIPSSSLGLHLQDQEFKCCHALLAGGPLHSNPYPCPECSATADPFGDHQVGCGGNGDRISRHNAVRDVIFAAAQSAALGPSKEVLV